MLFVVLQFVAFLACLILGAWCVSEGGDILGQKYDATIIGGFVIAWLNTAPETIFFITALESGQPHFAIGAISGSAIVVCTIAVGACVYIGAKARKNETISLFPGVRRQAHILGGSLLVLMCNLLFGFQAWIGYFGVFLYCAFILWTLLHKTSSGAAASSSTSVATKLATVLPSSIHHHDEGISVTVGSAHHHHHHSGHDSDDDSDSDDEEEQPIWKGVGYLLAGGALIYICSEPFIGTVVKIGQSLGIAPLALAFFFAPIASEAPEILESISLSRKGKTQNINIAFSNLIGGTISKTTLLLGIFNFYSISRGYKWIEPNYSVSLSLVLICAGAAAAFGLTEQHGAVRGQLLVALFALCATVQFVTSYLFGAIAVA